MYYVYILKLSNKQIYTGFTHNLRERIKQHQHGKAKFTSKRLPVELIHYEAYVRESDARRREKFLKTSEGKNLLKKQIRDILTEKETISMERCPSGLRSRSCPDIHRDTMGLS
ncbi:MAG: GIY-YIG nuclease family protein [Candidatus Omnitrophica bacterium]|nr:GIY-YIG nuclease family protein [Candidatus Omnitrophota bacterium]